MPSRSATRNNGRPTDKARSKPRKPVSRATAARKAARATAERKIGQILSRDQRDRFNSLLGATFEGTRETDRPPRADRAEPEVRTRGKDDKPEPQGRPTDRPKDGRPKSF